VLVGPNVGVLVGVFVGVFVGHGPAHGVGVDVGGGVDVGVAVAVFVGVDVTVGHGPSHGPIVRDPETAEDGILRPWTFVMITSLRASCVDPSASAENVTSARMPLPDAPVAG
jgi:hypothetical protein